MNVLEAPSNLPPAAPLRSNDLLATGLRRRIMADLAAIAELLEPHVDELSKNLKEAWHTPFVAAMRSTNEREVLQAFTFLLESILVDPITEAPLDETALLGSDQYTYDPQSLIVFLSDVEVQYRDRSPMNRRDPTPFYTLRQHPVAPFMVQKLKGYLELLELHPKLRPPQIEISYNELAAQGRLVAIPVEPAPPQVELPQPVESERVQQRRLRSEQRARVRAHQNELLQIERLRASQEASAVQERMLVHFIQQAAEGHQRDREELAAIRVEDRSQALIAEQNILEASRRLDNARARINNLEETSERLRRAIEQAEKNDKILSQALSAAAEALRKAKKRKKKKLLKTIAVVGACALATIASGGSFVAMPYEGGMQVIIPTGA